MAPPETASPPRVARVLVVDDEASIRLGCVLALRSAGWRADGEGSARRALDRLTDPAERYDAVVLDYAMPELDGLAVAAALEPGRRPPILMASAHGDGAAALAALRLGIWDLLAKPLVPDELRRRVQRLVQRGTTTRAVPTGLDPVLRHCNRCAWADAHAALETAVGLPEDCVALVRGLLFQVAGDPGRARAAWGRARWWPGWERHGTEIWAELGRRLA
jgi:DNA-binding response OmpR family regulator